MNKVFRVIWSEAQGAWVAVSETTKSHSKRSRKAALALALAAGGLLGVTGYASATSTGEIGTGSIAIGPKAGDCTAVTDAKGNYSISIGCETGRSAEGNNQTNLGYQAGMASKGDDNAAFGSNAGESVTGNRNTGFGRSAGKGVKGNSNTSLGEGAGMFQNGDGNLSAGLSAGQSTYGDHNVMLGNQASTVGSTKDTTISRTVVIGSKAEAHFDDTVALGSNAKAEHKNSVALGHASQTADAAQIVTADIKTEVNGKTGTFTYSGFKGTASGVVSVGSAGAERQIINVAPGAITSTSTDAVNGSQLYGVAKGLNDQVNDLGSSVAGSLGGGSKYEGGKVSADLTVGGKNYTNVQDALNNIGGGWVLGSKAADGTTDQDLTIATGKKVDFNAGKNMEITSEQDADGNVVSTFKTKDDVAFTSVTTGGTVMNDNGLTITNGPSITKTGINAGNLNIINVKAGTADTHGVNVSQLKGLGSVIGDITIDNSTGEVTGPTFIVNGKDQGTVSGAITKLDEGWTLSDGDKSKQIKAGDTAIIKAGDNMDVAIDDVTGEMIVKTQADVNFNSVTLGDITQPGQYTQLTQGGLNIGGNTFVNNGGLTFNNSSVSVSANGINAGGNKIINVAKGEDDSDAVNVGQLKDYVGKNDGSWNISNGTTSSKVATGNTVKIEGGKTGTTAGNINVTHDGNGNLTIESNANVKHDNVTVGGTTINNDTGITVGDTNINNQGNITVGDKVSVNKDGVTVGDVSITVDGGINAGDKKITGVADGTIAAGSKDAVNGGQIHDMQVQIDQQAGGWELNDGKGGKQQVKAGDSVAIVGGDNINVEFDADGKMVVETTPDVTHNSVNIESTDANGNIVKGPSMNKDGIDAAGNKVTGVADGTIAAGSKDAVNGGQIHDLEQKISEAGGWELSDGTTDKKVNSGDKVTIKGGDNIDVAINDDGDMIVKTNPDVTHDSVTTGDTVMNDNGLVVKVDDGKGGLKDGPSITKNGVDAGGKKVTGVADGDINKDSTDAVNGSQLDATNNRVTKNEGDITNLDNRVTKTEGDITNLDNRVTKTEGDITNLDNRVTKNEGDITNLDNRVTKNEGDITNLDNRVTKNEGDIENNAGDIENIQNGKDGMFQVSQDYNAPKPKPTGKKSAAGGAGAVASGDNSTAVGNDAQATASNSTALGNSAFASANNSVALGQGSVADRENSVSVGTVGGERQITNVAAGVAPTDAVNVSQLDALGSKVNQYFNAANKRIDKVDNNARAGIAAAMAAGTLPQSTLPGKSMVTVGASTYRGESALAIGVSRLSDNARTVIKANASADSRGNAGAAVGAGWHW